MLPWDADLAGSLDRLTITSDLLRGNPLGDPHERPLWVYTPPGYDPAGSERYPAVYVIQGYTGHVTMWGNRARVPPAVPRDGRPGLRRGGRAAVRRRATSTRGRRTAGRSSSTRRAPARYHSYLCDEVVPFVDAHYRTIPDRESRAISGKSSGGFGAMITPMLRPDLFGALATHAGDALYEYCYLAGVRRGGAPPARLRRRHLALVGRVPRPPGVQPRRGRAR